jgi:hypothetical protein
MSAQLLSVDLTEQEKYIDLQRMRARQVWDECKHSMEESDLSFLLFVDYTQKSLFLKNG